MEQIRYASFWNRFLAVTVDSIVLTILFFVLSLPAAAAGIVLPLLGTVLMVLLWIVMILYTPWLQSSSRRATIGMQFIGLIVTDTGGGKLSFGRAFVRYLLTVASYMILLPFLLIFFTKKKQALHDLAVGSVVVDVAGPSDTFYFWSRRIFTVLILLSVLLTVAGIARFSATVSAHLSEWQQMDGGHIEFTEIMQTPDGSLQHIVIDTQAPGNMNMSIDVSVPQQPVVSDIDTGTGMTEQLFALAKGSGDNDFDVLRLLNRGAEINARDASGRTPLFYAVQQGHIEMAKVLVFKGADINVKDHRGVTIRSLAAKQPGMPNALASDR